MVAQDLKKDELLKLHNDSTVNWDQPLSVLSLRIRQAHYSFVSSTSKANIHQFMA